MTDYILLIVSIIFCTLILNFIRFKGNDLLNKLILTFSTLVLILLDELFFDFTHAKWFLFIFVGISILCFNLYGAIISPFLAWIFLCIFTRDENIWILLFYLLLSASVYFTLNYISKSRKQSDEWLQQLIANSKQLNVFKEVSFAMQQTLDLQKLLLTILTSVTAGYGLGFNRAMILLMNKNETKLNGVLGIGPMSTNEGYKTWEEIINKRYRLKDLIKINESEKETDSKLNERVKNLKIWLYESHFLSKILKNGSPQIIEELNQTDRIGRLLAEQFNMSSIAVFPLIYQSKKLGVLIIDNPVNKKPITVEDLDSILPLANQAAIGIQHSRLYSDIEDMAIRDGLTGLLNQRAFQKLIVELLPNSSHDILSLIMLDIDHFKHYNDTNGHLLGNEVLIQLANVIEQSIRESDLAFRFGGEEFVILLPNTDKNIACKIAERIRKSVENTHFPNGEKQPLGRLTISLGVSVTNEIETINPNNLIEVADKALYKAKELGRNIVVS